MNRLSGLLPPPMVLRTLLLWLAAVPAVYLLFAIQYSAITVPFWDHTDLIRFIVAWHDGSLHISDLWSPHNHTRPFVYRLVMLLNAVATDWDVRSEYIYLYLSIYGTFACFAWLACRVVTGTTALTILPLTLLVISLLLFSPVGHNNHWWSMMFQLDATNFFIALSFALVFARPASWGSHIVAAVSCWLAAFTLTNGFFAMAVIIVAFQISTPNLWRPDRFAVFWIVNLVVASACYLPGLHMDGSPTHPTTLQLLQFSLAYLGAPLRGLLWFPYRNMFQIPISIVANVICGVGLLLSCLYLSWNALRRVRQRDPAALVLYGFAGFAVLSAFATGWARAAFDEFGVSNGNASRYTVFGVYLLLGQVYYLGAGLARGWWEGRSYPLLSRSVVLTLSTIFIVAAFVSYGRARVVYIDAHQFNRALTQTYVWGTKRTPNDGFIHPSPASVVYLKNELQRLEIGPYANRVLAKEAFPVGKFSKPIYLSAKRTVTQRFEVTENGLKRIMLKFVTPNGAATTNFVKWQVVDIATGQAVGNGQIAGAKQLDWADTGLRIPVIDDSKGRAYELVLEGTDEDGRALCLPLYDPVPGSVSPPVVSDQDDARRGRQVMELTLEYAK